MIPNCEGCNVELQAIKEYSEEGLHFAGKGLFEKGHLFIVMVNDEGRVIIE